MGIIIGQKMWYEALGFTDNPFSLEPISATPTALTSFVDRQEEREQLRKFVQERSGAVIVLSQIGEGKSSFLNLAELMAKQLNKLVIRVNPRSIPARLDKFLPIFIVSIKNADSSVLTDSQRKFLDETLKEIELSVEDGFNKNILIVLERLYSLFSEVPAMLIMDDLDKITDLKDFEHFLRKVIDPIPKNFLVLTTGNINQVVQSNKLIRLLYEIFNIPIVLGVINIAEKLKEFVTGRMNAYARVRDVIHFPDELYAALLDKTRGNLRETFRYLSELLKSEQNYGVEQLITVVKNVDRLKIGQLDDMGKVLLNTLAGKKMSLEELKLIVGGSGSTIRNRLDDLEQLGLAFKSKIVGQGKKIGYSSPQIIKQVIDEVISHSALLAQDSEILRQTDKDKQEG